MRIAFRANTKKAIWYQCENLSDLWLSTLEIGKTQLCAPKSPFLSVNSGPIRYGFRAGEKAIRYGVNIT